MHGCGGGGDHMDVERLSFPQHVSAPRLPADGVVEDAVADQLIHHSPAAVCAAIEGGLSGKRLVSSLYPAPAGDKSHQKGALCAERTKKEDKKRKKMKYKFRYWCKEVNMHLQLSQRKKEKRKLLPLTLVIYLTKLQLKSITRLNPQATTFRL